MRRILTILLVTALFVGCADGKFRSKIIPSAACGGTVDGYTVTYIAYGDSKLVVIPLSIISDQTEWRFILRPLKIGKSGSVDDYKGKKVTITGMSPADPPLPPDHNSWIDTAGTAPGNEISGTYNGAADHMLTACVKGLPDTTRGTTYKFVVDVQDVGTLDPRADVQ